MRNTAILLVGCFCLAVAANASELAAVPAQELLETYARLRAIPPGTDTAVAENVVLQRDAGTFRFNSGRFVFAAPVAGRVLAASFQGEGSFELDPPSPADRRQISRFSGGPKLVDTFTEAVFFFTDDSFAALSRQMKIQAAEGAASGGSYAAAQKRYAGSYNGWVDNRRKGNPAMRNLAARILSDMTDIGSKGFFLADFKAGRSGNLMFHVSWNRDSLLLPDYGKGDEVILLHLNPGNYYEWWAGFHLASEYANTPHPDHGSSILHCERTRIDLQVSKDNRIAATAEMEYVVTGGAPRVLPFNLEGVLRILSIEDATGAKLGFIQESRDLDSDPWLILPAAAGPGEKHRLKIAYEEDSTADSRIVYQQGDGLHYVTSRESWFPSFGSFDDRTQFELRARSPRKYKFVASGTLVASETAGEELVTSWKSDIPLGVFGFNYGTFVESSQTDSKLTVTAYSGKEIPDELKELQAQINMEEMEGNTLGVRLSGIMRGGFNTASQAKRAAEISMQAFKLYQILYGNLPFTNISVTEQPVRGYGQSWPNLIFLPYDLFLDATTRKSLGLQESSEEKEFFNIVAAHEMAHQWWGHLVGWKTYHDQWLSEGLAMHASVLYLRQFEPKKWNNYWDLRRTWMFSRNASGRRPVDAGPVWLNAQLDAYEESSNSSLIYYKGTYIFEMLRAIMFDVKTADKRFMDMVRDFAATYAGKNASTEDFRRIVEKHAGEPMDWFFDQWVYGTDIPSYKFSYKVSDTADGQTDLSMTITQSDVPESFKMRLPVYATVNGSLRRLGVIRVAGTKPYTVSIKLPVRPEKVQLDPEHSILAHIDQ